MQILLLAVHPVFCSQAFSKYSYVNFTGQIQIRVVVIGMHKRNPNLVACSKWYVNISQDL